MGLLSKMSEWLSGVDTPQTVTITRAKKILVKSQTNSIMNETFEKVIFEVIMCANIIVCAKITIPIIPNF